MAVAGSSTGSLVGRRCRVAGKPATVRWGPGPVQAPPSRRPPAVASVAAEGEESGVCEVAPEVSSVEVIGVEYDEPGHGKHNGAHQGVQLFTCREGFGSFVKVEKVELGVSIQWQIADKYFASLLPDAASKASRAEVFDAVEYVDSKGRDKEVPVELVGRYELEQQQKRLESFVEVSLGESNLESRYPEDVWEGDWSLPNIRSLWLDKTLLRDWADVLAICELCPRLEWLSLARSHLLPVPPNGALGPPRGAPMQAPDSRLAIKPFTSCVRTLVLTETMVTWQDISALDTAGRFPFLEHLHLPRNQLSDGVPADLWAPERCPLPRLKSLVLDDNGIADWGVLRRATSTFSTLESLHLNANLLGATLEGLVSAGADETPRRLTALSLAENRLESWRAIGALAAYALLELKVQKNPLTEGAAPVASAQLVRQVIIALMPTLMRLNASQVTAKERTAAERYFLSMVQQQSPVVQALSEDCDVTTHAARLRALHGDASGGVATEQAQASRAALVHSLVEVTLRPIGAAVLDRPPVKKRVPHTMTVGELARLCQSIFKQVPLERLKLLLADPELLCGVPLDDESRELGFYGVAEGAEIRVDDAQDMQGERAVAHVEHFAKRMEQSAACPPGGEV